MNFLSREEILKDLHKKIADEDKKFFREEKDKPYYVWARVGLGRFIRNHYGLWNENHPYCKLDAEPDSLQHADNYSGEIVEQFLKEIDE